MFWAHLFSVKQYTVCRMFLNNHYVPSHCTVGNLEWKLQASDCFSSIHWTQSFFYSSYSLVGTVSFETTNAMKLVAWHSDSWSTIVLKLTSDWPSAKYLIKTSRLAQSERNNHHSQYTSATWQQFCQLPLDYKFQCQITKYHLWITKYQAFQCTKNEKKQHTSS